MRNIFSIDVEDWFIPFISESNPLEFNSPIIRDRLNIGMDILLQMLQQRGYSATFFVLGCTAEANPDVIKRIEAEGHELASHGYSHKKITSMKPFEFENDIEKSLDTLNKIVKCDILGYRAPCFTITKDTLWAFDIIKKLGFKYDSSVFPFGLHREYGITDFSLKPVKLDNGLLEFPLSCVSFAGLRLPVSGGGYLRLYPYSLSKHLAKKVISDNRPFIFYIHPWELDVHQPRISKDLISRWRHYQNIESTKLKLKMLLLDFEFCSFNEFIGIKNDFY